MPLNSFQNILQMEIRAPKLQSMAGKIQWIKDGLVIALPNSFTHSGWRAKALQVSTDLSGKNSYSTIEQSRFGARRMAKASADDGTMPVEATVYEDSIFVSKVKLPLAAAKSLSTTIGLRLNDISPIPRQDTAFAVGESPCTTNDKIEVDVAIVRKQTLLDMRKSSWGKRITTIGACPDPSGAYKFIFEKPKNSEPINRKIAIDAALIGVAVLALFAAIDTNFKSRHRILEQYETVVLSELRSVREGAALFDDIEPISLEQNRGEDTKSVTRDLQTLLAMLPKDVLIEQLRYQANIITLSGFIPSNSGDKSAFKQLIIEPTDRPGFDRFRLTIEQGKLP